MATIAVPVTTVIVIENQVTDRCALHPRTGEPLMFASFAAARIAMRDLALPPSIYGIAERSLD